MSTRLPSSAASFARQQHHGGHAPRPGPNAAGIRRYGWPAARARRQNGWPVEEVPYNAAQGYQHARHVAAAGKGASSSSRGDGKGLQPGDLVDFTKDSDSKAQHLLGLVTEPDGKRNWWIVDQRGHRSSLPAKSVALVLPGAGYTRADLDRIADGAVANADDSLLEIAWSIVSEGGDALSLEAMADLMFGDASAISQYSAYRMLLDDLVYFKQTSKGGGVYTYAARPQAAVEASLALIAREAAEEAARQAFSTDMQAALTTPRGQQPNAEAWQAGLHAARIAALREYALLERACPEANEVLAAEALGLLGRRRGPDDAWKLLVDAGVVRRHEPLHVLRSKAPMAFSPALEQQAQELVDSPPPDLDAGSRADLSHLPTFTIDDASTTEVDDGLSIEQLPDGTVRCWIHVADPTRWLEAGSGLEREARRRQRTLYFPWGLLPMFPRVLAEGPFSLKPMADGQPCCALSICATLGPDGRLASTRVLPSVVSVTQVMTYEQADADIALGPLSQHPQLQLLYEAARLRKAWRASEGSIDIDTAECKLEVPYEELDSAKPKLKMERISQWESAARQTVAEMMILAGEAVGTLGAELRLPLPYRAQEQPQLPSPEDLRHIPEGPCMGFALRRCMVRGTVETTPKPHASLALSSYVQVTSPIRRYGDLIAHFNLKAHLRGQPLPFSPSDIAAATSGPASEAARELGRVEGDAQRYWTAEYFRQNRDMSWSALVLGWFRQEARLASVCLEDLGLEAIVRADFDVFPGDRVSVVVYDALVQEGLSGSYRLGIAGLLSEANPRVEEEEAEGDMVSDDSSNVTVEENSIDGMPDSAGYADGLEESTTVDAAHGSALALESLPQVAVGGL